MHPGIASGRSPVSWLIVWDGRRGVAVPGTYERIDDSPGLLHFIRACKKAGVARHAIQKKWFVSLWEPP